MHKPSWHFDKIMANIKKKKFKAMFRYFFDSNYKRQVDHMIRTVKQRPVRCVESSVRIGDITYGHPINYPKWVSTLRWRIQHLGYTSLDPIKIIWDETKGKYLVVDGNHRLAALKRELINPNQRIPVQLLVPLERYSQ